MLNTKNFHAIHLNNNKKKKLLRFFFLIGTFNSLKAVNSSFLCKSSSGVRLQHANKGSPFSFDRIYLHFLSYSNAARGCLSSDLTAHKLFNHNCLHTVLHHTSRLCICILRHPGCKYPLSDFTPGLQCSLPPLPFIIEHCSLQHYRGDAGSPVVTQVGYL